MKKLLIYTIAWALPLTACTNPVRRPEPISKPLPKKSISMLVYEAKKHIGEPYRSGGVTAKGWDCSGFVRTIYRNSLQIDLPRTANDMFQTGNIITPPHARQGDLVFFKIRHKRASHVGIYLGHGKFIHVSRARGVVISTLNESYYKSRFIGLRRFAPELVASRR